MNKSKRMLLCGSLVAAASLGTLVPIDAAEKTITVMGQILSNQFDSVVDTTEIDGGVLFWNDSEQGRAILTVCKHGDICEVTGAVDDKQKIKEFMSVSRVRKIHAKKK